MGQFVEAARTGRLALIVGASGSNDSASESVLGDPVNGRNSNNAGSVAIEGAAGSARTTARAVATTAAAPPPLPVNEPSRRGTFRSAALAFAAGIAGGLILAVSLFGAWGLFKQVPQAPLSTSGALNHAHPLQKKSVNDPDVQQRQEQEVQAEKKRLEDKTTIEAERKSVDADRKGVDKDKLELATDRKRIERDRKLNADDLERDRAKLKEREDTLNGRKKNADDRERALDDRERALQEQMREPSGDQGAEIVRPIHWYYTLPGAEPPLTQSTVILTGQSGKLEDFTTPDTSLSLVGLEAAAQREKIKLREKQAAGGLMCVEILSETGSWDPICCFTPNKGKLQFAWLPPARLLTARRAVRNTILKITQREQAKRYIGLLHESMSQPIIFEPKQDGSYAERSLFQNDEARPTAPLLVLASEPRIEKELPRKVGGETGDLKITFLLRGKLSLSVNDKEKVGHYKLALRDELPHEAGAFRQYPIVSVRVLSIGTKIDDFVTEVLRLDATQGRSGPHDRLRSNR
jgi:hypothetical protein